MRSTSRYTNQSSTDVFFQDPYVSMTFLWLFIKSLTFSRPISNSLTLWIFHISGRPTNRHQSLHTLHKDILHLAHKIRKLLSLKSVSIFDSHTMKTNNINTSLKSSWQQSYKYSKADNAYWKIIFNSWHENVSNYDGRIVMTHIWTTNRK